MEKKLFINPEIKVIQFECNDIVLSTSITYEGFQKEAPGMGLIDWGL